jgi:hypothetical protein
MTPVVRHLRAEAAPKFIPYYDNYPPDMACWTSGPPANPLAIKDHHPRSAPNRR